MTIQEQCVKYDSAVPLKTVATTIKLTLSFYDLFLSYIIHLSCQCQREKQNTSGGYFWKDPLGLIFRTHILTSTEVCSLTTVNCGLFIQSMFEVCSVTSILDTYGLQSSFNSQLLQYIVCLPKVCNLQSVSFIIISFTTVYNYDNLTNTFIVVVYYNQVSQMTLPGHLS